MLLFWKSFAIFCAIVVFFDITKIQSSERQEHFNIYRASRIVDSTPIDESEQLLQRGPNLDMLERHLAGRLNVGETDARVAPIELPCVEGAWKSSLCYISGKSSQRIQRSILDHVFGVVNFTLKMYGVKPETNWQSLPIVCKYGDKDQLGHETHYSPTDKRLILWGKSIDDFDFDVVAHETGHAVLDFWRVDLNEAANKAWPIAFQVDALHEAFGDCTAIFSSLAFASYQGTFAQELSNLFRDRRNIPRIGPQWRRNCWGLRNPAMATDADYQEAFVNGDFHAFSQMFTNFVYTAIWRVMNYELYERMGSQGSPVNTDLRGLREAFVKSFMSVPVGDTTLWVLSNSLQEELSQQYPHLQEKLTADVTAFHEKLSRYFRK